MTVCPNVKDPKDTVDYFSINPEFIARKSPLYAIVREVGKHDKIIK